MHIKHLISSFRSARPRLLDTLPASHPTNSRNALSGNLPTQHRTSAILDCELQSLCTGSNSCCEWPGVLRFLGVVFQAWKMILVAHKMYLKQMRVIGRMKEVL